MLKENKSFSHWFTNVFWYHYKWWFLLGVFVVALALFILIESLGTVKYDFTVVFAQNGDVPEAQASEILDLVGGTVGDINGDGKVNLRYVSVNLGENYDQILVYLTDPEISLFILDEYYSSLYCSLGYFDDKLADYGIETGEDDPYRVFLGDTGVFKKSGLTGSNYYGHIIDWTSVGKGSQELTDGAVESLKAILAS
ncbi:MAG: hypothetical protein ACOX7I_03170 [Oscillospiraceae bacterium]|jgi:hypothetical protein